MFKAVSSDKKIIKQIRPKVPLEELFNLTNLSSRSKHQVQSLQTLLERLYHYRTTEEKNINKGSTKCRC